MNCLHGTISKIKSNSHMSVVETDVKGDIFKTIIIETPSSAAFLSVGTGIKIMFKETEVGIAKNFGGKISIQNKLLCSVKTIETSELLSKVILAWKDEEIASIITTTAAEQLELKAGDEVLALIKTNEIMVAPL